MASYHASFEVAGQLSHILEVCMSALQHTDVKKLDIDKKRSVVTASYPMSIWSFGEKITVHVNATASNDTYRVSVTSKNAQLGAWGKNKQNVEQFVASFWYVHGR